MHPYGYLLCLEEDEDDEEGNKSEIMFQAKDDKNIYSSIYRVNIAVYLFTASRKHFGFLNSNDDDRSKKKVPWLKTKF